MTPTGQVYGTSHFRAKMNPEKVEELRRLRQQRGLPYRELGTLFGIDHKTARSIAIGLTWVSTGEAVYRADDAELDQVRALVARGVSMANIARALGVTDGSVKRLMRKQGIRSIHARSKPIA
ncbi:MAG: hypothetical protein K0B16_08495 [Burkholderiaceae bacterium]|nr:hypothetical protein [Burkholderiaceae bacterium]